MDYQTFTLDENFLSDRGAKRILALDGGGLRGLLSLGILERIEDPLRERHGGAEDFRLCHYFDLIAGTSVGAITAAGLAEGLTVGEPRDRFFSLGQRVPPNFSMSPIQQTFLQQIARAT